MKLPIYKHIQIMFIFLVKMLVGGVTMQVGGFHPLDGGDFVHSVPTEKGNLEIVNGHWKVMKCKRFNIKK